MITVHAPLARPVQRPDGSLVTRGALLFSPDPAEFVSELGSWVVQRGEAPIQPDGTFTVELEWKDGLSYDVHAPGVLGFRKKRFTCGTGDGLIADDDTYELSDLLPVAVPSGVAATIYTKGDKGDPGDTGGIGPQGPTGPSGGGVRWVALGDSLTSLTGGGAPYMGFVTQADILSAGKVRALYNAGVSGDTAAMALARINTDVLAHDPTLVSVWLGTNDVTNGVTLATYQANMTAIVDVLEAAGCTVVLITIPPRNDLTKLAQINAWNAWLKKFAAEQTIHLIDAYDVLVDRSTGAYASGLGYVDGLHLTQLGHNKVAAAFVTTILPRLIASEPLQPLTNADPNNMLANGLFLADTGGIPDLWYPDGGPTTGFTEGLVTDSDFRGRAWQVTAVTPPSFRLLLGNCTGGTFDVGDTLLFTSHVEVGSSSGVPDGSGLTVNCSFYGPDTTIPAASGIRLAGLNGLVSTRLVVPAATTLVQMGFLFNPTAAGTATFRVGEPGVYNLTRLGLV